MKYAAFVFIATLIQGSLTPLFACQCGLPPPPCGAFWQSDLVFSGRVETITYVWAPRPEFPHYLVTFTVDTVLRGDRASPLTIKTAIDSASCGYSFRQGESYLVYGYASRGSIWTGLCGRTRPLKQAAEDLAYAASLAGPGAGGRIYGMLRRWDDYLGRSPVTKDLGGLAGVPVIVDGPAGQRRTRSRKDGTFEVTGLAPGSYRVSLALPRSLTYRADTLAETFQLASAHACERADFSVHFDGRITGTVLDAGGAPVVGGNVVLTPAELADDAVGVRFNRRAVTDEDGAFELQRIPPGRYVLGLNIEPSFANMALLPGREGRWVWPRVFHPGSLDAAKATRITLGEGEKKIIRPLRLPSNLVSRAVTGTARWPDGQPVSGGWVSLLDAETKVRVSGIVRTTSDGSFTVAAFAGQRVFVQVYVSDRDPTSYGESPPIDVGPGAPPAPLVVTVKPQ